MSTSRQGLVAARGLAPEEVAEIRGLAEMCNALEGLDLTLNLAPEPPPGETNQFLCYQDGVLAGYCSMYPGRNTEMSGMVHPDYRRRGIGRELFAAARDEVIRRGARALLICETGSASGQAFVSALGLPRDMAEHRMELRSFPVPPPSDERFRLRRAEPEDVDTLARVSAEAFGDPLDRTRERVTQLMAALNQRFYLGLFEQEPVGALRVEDYDGRTFIYGFGVLPQHRGQGLGRRILTRTLEILRAEGRTAVGIEVETDNVPALALYHSCGFEIVRTYEYFKVETPSG